MNTIIYNIALIILSLGFILMVIYITMILTKKSTSKLNTTTCINNNKLDTNNLIYDDRPSITYVKMFNQPSVGFGYKDFDVNDNSNTTSFYTKSNK